MVPIRPRTVYRAVRRAVRFARRNRRVLRRITRYRKSKFGGRGGTSTTYRPRFRVRPIRNRRLAGMVFKLRNKIDVDTSFYSPSSPETYRFEARSPSTGVIRANSAYLTGMNWQFEQMLGGGNRIQIKSLNERIVLQSASTVANNISDLLATRRVRILYILTKNEEISKLEEIFDFNSAGTLATLNPPYVANPGLTYRIIYDKTYSVNESQSREVLVRLPRSVFYDRGSVQYSIS